MKLRPQGALRSCKHSIATATSRRIISLAVLAQTANGLNISVELSAYDRKHKPETRHNDFDEALRTEAPCAFFLDEVVTRPHENRQHGSTLAKRSARRLEQHLRSCAGGCGGNGIAISLSTQTLIQLIDRCLRADLILVSVARTSHADASDDLVMDLDQNAAGKEQEAGNHGQGLSGRCCLCLRGDFTGVWHIEGGAKGLCP
jgi:hypothetical protein